MNVRSVGGRWLPPLLSLLFRALSATWRLRYEGRALLEAALREGPLVLAFWHGEQLALLAAHRGLGLSPLVSWSADGELLARALPGLGYGVIRGSSSRGGAEAMGEALALLARGGSPALAVDGPRGPRHQPKPGAARLAAASGRPLLFVVAEVSAALRLRSWDRFEIPLPFATVRIRYGRMETPANDRAAIEQATSALRDALLSARGSTPP